MTTDSLPDKIAITINGHANNFASFDDWFQGCGFQFYHNTDRYTQFANHVFVACDNDISEIVQGLTGGDEDAIRSCAELLRMDQEEYAFIGYDDDAIMALQKCVDKMKAFKDRLDNSMSKERYI